MNVKNDMVKQSNIKKLKRLSSTAVWRHQKLLSHLKGDC